MGFFSQVGLGLNGIIKIDAGRSINILADSVIFEAASHRDRGSKANVDIGIGH